MKFLSLSSIVSLILCSTAKAQTHTLSGSCNYGSVSAALTAGGVADINAFLSVATEAEAIASVSSLCDAAYSAKTLPFDKVFNKGYQFDREFFHGNTELNNFESETVPQGVYDRIDTIDDLIKPSEIIGWPSYLDEFESCPSQAAMCCWTADKFSAGGGTCASEGGCADAEPADNTDICHHDMSKSPLAARVRAGAAVFSGDSEGAAHCQAFVWDDSTAAFNGNLLFDAVNYGMDNGYTRAVPGAPMCGCVEHMPVVSTAGCKSVAASESSTITKAADGTVSIEISALALTYNTCDATSEAHGLGKYIVGDCDSFEGQQRDIRLMGYVYVG
mmetsp:Transcript_11814/g.15743  ORF Transcript_11814/g.15743 Transcript_11814/m.15743 type:complete len:331 (+) Transcript_11814:99-1091(+)